MPRVQHRALGRAVRVAIEGGLPTLVSIAACFAMPVLAACGDETAAPSASTTAADAGADAAPPGFDAGSPGEPSMPCPAGDVIETGGSCRPAGVPDGDCGEGFASTDGGACDAVLPSSACPAGELALPGEMSCHPVAPCGAGPWGEIPVDATTQYVDASYAGADSDGSAAKPWKTVQAGVDAAAPGGVVAIAKGSYAELVSVQGKPVLLWGACPSETTVVGPGGGDPIVVLAGAQGSEIHDLGVAGQGVGVTVHGALGVLVDRAWIHDTTNAGVAVDDSGGAAALTVTRSLLEHVAVNGVFVWGASVTLDQTVVRDVQAASDGTWGRGLSIASDADSDTRASVTLKRSIVERSRSFSVIAFGADVLVEDSLVRDTLPEQGTGDTGTAMNFLDYPEASQFGAAVLRRSVVERSHRCGVCAEGSDLELEATVVRDVEAEESTGDHGMGVVAIGGQAPADPLQRIAVRNSVVERCRKFGLAAAASDADFEGVVVRDVDTQLTGDAYGRGVSFEVNPETMVRSTAAMRGVVVERSHEFGVVLAGADATIDSIAVRDVAPDGKGRFGRGIGTETEITTGAASNLVLRNALVEHVFELGVDAIGATLDAEAVVVRDVSGRATDGRLGCGFGIQLSFETFLDADATVKRALVEGAHEAGVYVGAATATLDDVTVRGTLEDSAGLGDGILVAAAIYGGDIHAADVSIRSSHVSGSPRAGVSAFASRVTLEDTVLACNAIQLDGETAFGGAYELVDLGGNRCGCEEDAEVCKVLSSGLSPPEGIGP